jgi:hypothetical protein
VSPRSALFGLFSLIYGVSQITTGVELRRAGQTPNKALVLSNISAWW